MRGRKPVYQRSNKEGFVEADDVLTLESAAPPNADVKRLQYLLSIFARSAGGVGLSEWRWSFGRNKTSL